MKIVQLSTGFIKEHKNKQLLGYLTYSVTINVSKISMRTRQKQKLYKPSVY